MAPIGRYQLTEVDVVFANTIEVNAAHVRVVQRDQSATLPERDDGLCAALAEQRPRSPRDDASIEFILNRALKLTWSVCLRAF